MALLDGLQVFYGESNASLSRIYARLISGVDVAGLSLTGFVRGPFCEFSQTLPVTVSFRGGESGGDLLASAAIPDPCFWSPDLPSLYQVHVELRRKGEIIETEDRQLGIRAFGPRRRSLFLNNQRWVPRCVRGRVARNDVTSYREAAASMYVVDPDDSLCSDASRNGVLLIVEMNKRGDDIGQQLRRLSRWASVAIIVVEELDDNSRDTGPNLLFAQSIRPQANANIASWADLVIGIVDDAEPFGRHFSSCELPVLALRRYDESSPVDEARQACDHLQRDLAPFGDFAGYIV